MGILPKNDMSVLLLDNYETYYWVGFILADGHYQRRSGFSITLSDVDRNHLIKLQQYVQCCKVIDLKNYGKKCYPQIRISFQNKEIGPKVADKFGIRRDKTYYPPDLNWIKDKDLFLALFAGYVDGDGSIEYADIKGVIKPCTIRFHVHAAWKPVLELMRLKLIEYYQYDISLPSIKKDGYLKWCISDFRLIKQLKRDLDNLHIPLLNRKWDKVNLDYLSLKETDVIDSKIIQDNYNKTSQEISKEYNIPYSRVTRLKRKICSGTVDHH